jgi:hypothetical protein
MQALLENLTTTTPNHRELSHAINNRLNALVLGLSVLEQVDSVEVAAIACTLKQELRELEQLILTHNDQS